MTKLNNKSSNAVVSERVNEIVKMLYRFATRRVVLQYATKNEWKLSSRAVDSLIQKANKIIEMENQVDRKQEFYKIKASYQDLLLQAYRDERYNDLRLLLKDYCEFLGMNSLNINIRSELSAVEKRLIDYMQPEDIDDLAKQIKE